MERGSNPVARSRRQAGLREERLMQEQVDDLKRDCMQRARVAQSAERILGKDEVTSSILVAGSSFLEQVI